MSEKLDSTRTALVDTKAYWKPITPETPRGAKVFLINKKAKSATTGTIGNNEGFFTHYFPMPIFDSSEDAPQTIDRAAPAAPQGWKPINTAPKDKFVLLACPSGYTTTPWVFTTGIMHSDYKAGRWIDHANDDLTDWGMTPMFWRDDVVSPDAATPAAPSQETAVPDVELRPEDFTVEVLVTPMGGFNPNVTHGVRVTHKPTGLSVSCDTERSQHKNRHIAFEQIKEMLADHEKAAPAVSLTPTDHGVTAAAKILAERFDCSWDHMPEQGRNTLIEMVHAIAAALHKKG